jgi:23S rRNA (uracil1939-C5)-methyltransferase
MNAPCIYYPKCGGCQLQHLDEAAYRAHKAEVLTQLFPGQNISYIWGKPASRRRAEFKVDASGKLGFFAPQSHELVPIDHCLAVVPEMDELIIPLQTLAKSLKPEKIFVTMADSGIELVLTMKREPPLAILKSFAEKHNIASIVVNDSIALMRHKIRMQFSDTWIDMPAGAFLQPTAEGQQAITNTIDRMIPKAKKIAEFFCGIGTYSFLLAKKAPVLAFEMSDKAVAALKGQARITAAARDIERFPVQHQEIPGVDVAVLNPPRNGAGPQCKALARSEVKRIVMISCHPQTLSRDIKILSDAGFAIKEMVAVDQFHWTHHLETVCLLERK